MLMLSPEESEQWTALGTQACRGELTPEDSLDGQVRRNLLGAFRYYIGTSSSGRSSAEISGCAVILPATATNTWTCSRRITGATEFLNGPPPHLGAVNPPGRG